MMFVLVCLLSVRVRVLIRIDLLVLVLLEKMEKLLLNLRLSVVMMMKLWIERWWSMVLGVVVLGCFVVFV